MAKVLPQRFNPDLLARDSTLYEVVIPQRQMQRLGNIVSSVDHDVVCSARFSRRKEHIVVSGTIKTTFDVQCQRCLESMSVPVEDTYEFIFVENEEKAEALPKQLDPVILDEHGQIHVVDLFEDEVILHVPDIPRHEDSANCRIAKAEFGEVAVDAEEGKPNPFNALKDLRLH